MKKYIKPEIEISTFDIEDVVMTSVATPRTSIFVDGTEVPATGYGAQNFSIFEDAE